MAKASRARSRKATPKVNPAAPNRNPATVASTGVQARLVRADFEREQAFAHLLARFHRVCREWDDLVQQAVGLLGHDLRTDPPRSPASPPKGAE
ncbi:hypothetical protein [Microvirga arabica]|uniref:hypothetical protein n=1 Tax=Microvirga arabica TaxID=1128671 RepID=UPI00193983FE|nr:hypothetical protein [Microvirga arabica]MBM1172034.1 hypothetical protein [Microvirga arabica]